jgi:hypothetical protein
MPVDAVLIIGVWILEVVSQAGDGGKLNSCVMDWVTLTVGAGFPSAIIIPTV